MLSISQNVYPKVSVFEGDTVVLILPTQLKEMNKTFVRLDYFKGQTSILQKESGVLKEKCLYLETVVQAQTEQTGIHLQIIKDKDIQLQVKDDYLKEFKKVSEKKRKKEGFLIGAGAAVVGLLFGLVL